MFNPTKYAERDVMRLFRLDGRVALLTGAGGHLGRSMAKGLCEAGAHVVLNGRTLDKLQILETELRDLGFSVSTAAFDVTDETQVRQHVRALGDKHGRLDVLVNNAHAGRTGTIDSAKLEDFEAAFKVVVSSAFLLVQCATSLLESTAKLNDGGASVINISSMYGMVSPDPRIYGDSGVNSPPFYGSAKGALIQFTRYAGCHLAPKNIRVNSISPGPFPNPSIVSANPEFHKKLCDKNPMGRIGYASELKGAMVFLASDASSYVTGVNLPVDGGWTAW